MLKLWAELIREHKIITHGMFFRRCNGSSSEPESFNQISPEPQGGMLCLCSAAKKPSLLHAWLFSTLQRAWAHTATQGCATLSRLTRLAPAFRACLAAQRTAQVLFPLRPGVLVAIGHEDLLSSCCHWDNHLVQPCETTAVAPAFGSHLGSKDTRITLLTLKCKENIF